MIDKVFDDSYQVLRSNTARSASREFRLEEVSARECCKNETEADLLPHMEGLGWARVSAEGVKPFIGCAR